MRSPGRAGGKGAGSELHSMRVSSRSRNTAGVIGGGSRGRAWQDYHGRRRPVDDGHVPPVRNVLWLIVGCACVGVGLSLYLRAAERAFLAEAGALTGYEPTVRPVAEIASALRAAKLVTVEIDTSVSLSRGDASWRGDAMATLKVPVRLHYGVDMAGMKVDGVGMSPLTPGACVVRVPRPTRIATEVFLEEEKAEVEVGWMRLRSRAGEYYLGQARRDAATAAREMVLTPDDAENVERITREQVGDIVRRVMGERVSVRVVFEERP